MLRFCTAFITYITLCSLLCEVQYNDILQIGQDDSYADMGITKAMLEKFINELVKRGVNLKDSGLQASDDTSSDCKTLILRTLKHVGGLMKFRKDAMHDNIVNTQSFHPPWFETSYPYRSLDRQSADIMRHTAKALELLKDSLQEGGCTPLEITEALKEIPEIEGLFKKFLMPKEFCPYHPPYYSCTPGSPYRTYDGSCNNIQFPWWGKARIPFVRFLPPAYDDYIGAVRSNSSKYGVPLPDPLVVAKSFHFDRRVFDFRISNFFVMFAEFVFNDLYGTSVQEDKNGEPIVCDCTKRTNPECIYLESNGPNKRCYGMSRSSAAFLSAECTFLPREQINTVTSWLDLSQIYGSSLNQTERLREFRGGLLKTHSYMAYEYPPLTDDISLCRVPFNARCFDSGDGRINENLGVAAIYTLFIREHNKIANELGRVNPLWKDEDIFQEARRISIAQYQHVIFKEFLPVLLGPDVVSSNKLLPSIQGYFDGYNPNFDPTTRNEIASAVAPSLFTMFRSYFSRFSPMLIRIDEVRYDDINFNLTQAFNDSTQGLNSFLRGMLMDYASRFDKHFAEALLSDDNSDKIRNLKNIPASIILAGRDHGLASYNDYRQYCGLERAASFTDLLSHMDLETVALLSELYSSVDDIDLFVGGLSELPVSNALVGPTFACLLAAQFQFLKFGDRFYYEIDNLITKFTPEQLSEIRFTTMSRILCESINDLPFIQPNVFLSAIIDNNERKACFTYRRRMIQPWFDTKHNDMPSELRLPRIADLASGIHLYNDRL